MQKLENLNWLVAARSKEKAAYLSDRFCPAFMRRQPSGDHPHDDTSYANLRTAKLDT
jgi:hypothetical protein